MFLHWYLCGSHDDHFCPENLALKCRFMGGGGSFQSTRYLFRTKVFSQMLQITVPHTHTPLPVYLGCDNIGESGGCAHCDGVDGPRRRPFNSTAGAVVVCQTR